MPSLQDWMNCPLNLVDSLYDKYGEEQQWEEKILESLQNKILEMPSLEKDIPLLNYGASHNLQSGQLVRFRCMLQDMRDPEFYMKSYLSRDLRSGKRKYKCGMFKDLVDCGPFEETQVHDTDPLLCSRLSYQCISIPGESDWIREECGRLQEPSPSTSGQIRLCGKRSLDDDDNDGENMEPENETIEDGDNVKRSRTEQSSNNSRPTNNSESDSWLNFPIPNMEGKSVIVKVYDKEVDMSLNELMEVVGILSMDPKLTQIEQSDSMETDEMVTSPPVSLVPRLHAIVIKKLRHTNPHLPIDNLDVRWSQSCEEKNMNWTQCREGVMNVLKTITFGDEVAAELMLCNMLSRVYTRRDGRSPLGSFSMNLLGVPVMSDYTDKVYESLRKLLERSCKIDMSLQTMNTATFIPKKNYDKNQLKSGYLQLPPNTLLVLDETKMSNGQLNQQGMANILALGNLIRWQSVEYDFQYHRMEFSSDLPVLVLSEGKSLLPCQVLVPLNPAYPIPPPETHSMQLHEVFSSIPQSVLSHLRSYLTVARLLDYSLPADMQKLIQDDFVKMRREDQSCSAEDLDQLLVLAKLLSVSYGQSLLSTSSWERAKTIEKERKRRLVLLPSSS